MAELPSITEHPNRDVVIYDGHCGFCQKQVMRIHRWDSGNKLSFLSLHDPDVEKVAPQLTYDQMMDQMYVIPQTGEPRGGASAIRYLSRRLPRLYPVMPFLHIPLSLPIWRMLYKWGARRRYKLSAANACDSEQCELHL